MEIKQENLEYLLQRVTGLVSENRRLKKHLKELRKLRDGWARVTNPDQALSAWLAWVETVLAELEH